MFEFFTDLKVDWMGWRRPLIFVSVLLLVIGLISAAGRQFTPGGTDAFNLGVDFQGGTVITVKFKQKPSTDDIRAALVNGGVNDSVIQESTDKTDETLIKIPIIVSEGEQAVPEAPAANAQPGEAVPAAPT